MDRSSAATSFIATFILFELVVVFAVIAFMIWLYWRIFAKAGFSGALSLLNLVPGVGHLLCLAILAFGRWPIEDRRAGSPVVPPGTSVMPTA
jgi:hypothetical protein